MNSDINKGDKFYDQSSRNIFYIVDITKYKLLTIGSPLSVFVKKVSITDLRRGHKSYDMVILLNEFQRKYRSGEFQKLLF